MINQKIDINIIWLVYYKIIANFQLMDTSFSLIDLPLEIQLIIFVFSNSMSLKQVCAQFCALFELNPTNFELAILKEVAKNKKLEQVPPYVITKLKADKSLITNLVSKSEIAKDLLRRQFNRVFGISIPAFEICAEIPFFDIPETKYIPYHIFRKPNDGFLSRNYYQVVRHQVDDTDDHLNIKLFGNGIANNEKKYKYFFDVLEFGDPILLNELFEIYDNINQTNNIREQLVKICVDENKFEFYRLIVSISKIRFLFEYDDHAAKFITHDNPEAIRFIEIHHGLNLEKIVRSSIKKKANAVFDEFFGMSRFECGDVIGFINLSIEYKNEYVFNRIFGNGILLDKLQFGKCIYYTNKCGLINANYISAIRESCKCSSQFTVLFRKHIKTHNLLEIKNIKHDNFLKNIQKKYQSEPKLDNRVLKCKNNSFGKRKHR